jgi:hypothetical protein
VRAVFDAARLRNEHTYVFSLRMLAYLVVAKRLLSLSSKSSLGILEGFIGRFCDCDASVRHG